MGETRREVAAAVDAYDRALEQEHFTRKSAGSYTRIRHRCVPRTRMTTIVAAALLLLVALVAGCEGGGGDEAKPKPATIEPQQFTPVVASTLGAETAPVKGTDGKFHVVYELELTNAKAVPATLSRVDVVDASNTSRVVASLQGRELLDNMRTLGVTEVKNLTIGQDASRLLFVDVSFDSLDQAPDKLTHKLVMRAADNPGATKPTKIEYTATPFEIGAKTPARLGPPLAGAGWVVVNGCCAPGFVHRDAVQSTNGKLYDSQRFAVDYMRIGDDGKVVKGDASKPDNWRQYGADVLAVADGTIVATENDLEDQVPGSLPDPAQFDSLEAVDGNYIVVDFGGGVYGNYAHLQKGSVKVKRGEKVKRGDKLALLGNSGNTSAPHLHFHLMTSPEPLAADGIPYVIDAFDFDGEVPPRDFIESEDLSADFGKKRLRAPQPRQDELPLNLSIVNFPDGPPPDAPGE